MRGYYLLLNWTIVFFIITNTSRGLAQGINVQAVRLMFYNVENLFDINNDSLKNDEDFMPHGLMRWNSGRYEKKVNSLFKTIVAAGEWSPPEVIAFCEIENRKVIESLIYGTYLSKYPYGIIHEESPDQRGIDVCMIYRSDYIRIIDFRYWIPGSITREAFTTRSVLYVKMEAASDTIHMIINHWPSRRGGVLSGESNRMKISSMVREKSDSISGTHNGKIIILGDFNSTPDDREMKSLTVASATGSKLINLSEALAVKGVGTYRYMGTWEMIDQVIVSENLLTGKRGLYTEPAMLRIFSPDFLLTKDPKYPGASPFSTYKGYRYQGGFSDHLPILISLKFRAPGQQE